MKENITYSNFIQDILNTRGRFNIQEGYKERHHIIPKCIGGTNNEDNLIDLYAHEHFVAHKLLAEENPDNYKLVCAWWNMCNIKNNNEKDRYIPTPEEYENARRKFANYISNTRQGENHPFYGKHQTEEAIEKISNRSKGENNPMYGKPCYYKMTNDKIKKWKNNLILSSPKRIAIKCIENNKIYNSIREASRELNIIRWHINKSINEKCSVDGYTFIKINKEINEVIE